MNAPRQVLYAFVKDFENLPRFMEHLVSVRVESATRSHGTAMAPAGNTVEWDAEIVNDVPGAASAISWRGSVGRTRIARYARIFESSGS
jgi:uncharacterized membrane protein